MLFKKTKSLVKRIGMNMAVYGFGGVFIVMVLSTFIPKSAGEYIYALSIVFSLMTIIGAAMSVIGFFAELFFCPQNKNNK